MHGRAEHGPARAGAAVYPRHRTAHWTIEQIAPLPGARLTFRLTPHRPVSDLLDAEPAAQNDYWQALGWIYDQYDLTYYGVAWPAVPEAHAAYAIVAVSDPDSRIPLKVALWPAAAGA